MKKTLALAAFLAFAPLAHAQDSGRWETRVVTETTPGHWETRSTKVWQEPTVEVESRKLADGTTEHVKVERPGCWKTVTERVWVEPATKKVEKKVWVPATRATGGSTAVLEYSRPWDDTPRTATGRTEQPTRETPSVRTEEPVVPARTEQPAAPRAPRTLPYPSERPTSDPFIIEERSSFVPSSTPARQAVVSSPDPLVYQAPTPPPAPEPRVVYVQQQPEPERVVVVRSPAPAPRVVYVDDCAPRRYVSNDCWSRPTYYDNCGPRVRVGVGVGVGVGVRVNTGVGVRVGVGTGVGVRVGHRGGVGFRIGF